MLKRGHLYFNVSCGSKFFLSYTDITQFFPSSGRVDTAIWMHCIDDN